MKISQAIAYYGGSVTKLAAALDRTASRIYQIMKKGDEMPYDLACKLQVVTQGKLKANGKSHGKGVSPATRRKRD